MNYIHEQTTTQKNPPYSTRQRAQSAHPYVPQARAFQITLELRQPRPRLNATLANLELRRRSAGGTATAATARLRKISWKPHPQSRTYKFQALDTVITICNLSTLYSLYSYISLLSRLGILDAAAGTENQAALGPATTNAELALKLRRPTLITNNS